MTVPRLGKLSSLTKSKQTTEFYVSIVELDDAFEIIGSDQMPTLMNQRRNTPSDIAKPVRPTEFSLWVAFPLISLFIGLAIGLIVIFFQARMQGTNRHSHSWGAVGSYLLHAN